MTPIERIKNLDKEWLQIFHRTCWEQASSHHYGSRLRSLVWGIGEDNKVYINAAFDRASGGDEHRIIRLDGSERGITTGTLHYTPIAAYKRGSYAHRRFCKLVSNEVQCAVHEA